MADVSLDIQKEILATIEKMNTTLGQTNDLLNTGKKINDSMAKTQDKMVDSYDDIAKHQKEYNKQLSSSNVLMKGLEAIANKLKSAFLSIFSIGAIGAFLLNLMKMNQELRETAFRMGLGAKGLRQLQSATEGVVSATGMAAREAGDLVMSLTQITGKNKDIEALAITAGQFAKVTGVGADAAAQLTGNLSRMGGLGAASIKSVATTMATVQRAVGFTTGEMEELTRTTTKTTMLLKQMGKSSGDIEKFSKGTALLAGAFRSVGVAAEDALKIIEDLLDPTKVEDNAFLYSKLGISLSDAFAGNVDPGALAGKFKELGTQLKGMNPAAAGAMAKELGVSLSTLRQFDNIDMGKFGAAMKEAGGDYQKALASMQGEQTGPLERLKQMMNKFSVPLMKILNAAERILGPIINSLANFLEKGLSKVNPFIQKVVDFVEKSLQPMIKLLTNPATWLVIGVAILGIFILLKAKAKLFAKDLGESIGEGVRGGLSMGHEKGNAVAVEKAKKAGRAMSDDRFRRITETFQFQDKQEEASFTRSQANTAKHFKGIMEWSSRMQEGAAFGVKPAKALIEIANSLNTKARERYDIQAADNKQILDERRNRKYTIETEQEAVTKRMGALSAIIEKDGKLSASQEIELKNLTKRNEMLTRNKSVIEAELITIETRGKNASQALLETLSPEALANLEKELVLEKESVQKRVEGLNLRQKQIEDEELIRKKSVDVLQAEEKRLTETGKKNGLDTEGLARMKEIKIALDEQVSLEDKLSKEAANIVEQKKKEEDVIGDIAKKQEKILKLKPFKPFDLDADKKSQGFFTQLKNAGRAFGSNITGALTAGAHKLGSDLQTAAKKFGDGIKAIPGYLKTLGGGSGPMAMLKGAGSFLAGNRVKGTDDEGKPIIEKKQKKGRGGLTAAGAGIGLLIGMLMRLKPVQDMIAKLMKSLEPVLNSLGEALQPVIGELMPIFIIIGNLLKNLIPVMVDVAKTLIDALMPIIKMLLPPLVTIIKAILPAIKPIVKLLGQVLLAAMPLILKVLGLILTILGSIFWGIGQMVKIFSKNAGEEMVKAGAEMIKAGTDLMAGKQSTEDLTQATEDNTKATKKAGEDKPEVLRATGKEFVKEQEASYANQEETNANVAAQTEIQQGMAKSTEKNVEAAAVSANNTTKMVQLMDQMVKLLQANGQSAAQSIYAGGSTVGKI